jgi:hypothetical protein
MVSLAGHSAGDEWRRRLDRPVAVGGVDVGVTAPRGLDPDDDPALTSDQLGNLLDDERPRQILDDPAPHRLGRSRPSRPLLLNDGHRSAPPSSYQRSRGPPARHRVVHRSDASITDSGTVLGKVSERTRQRVDEVVKRIVGEAHDQAARLLADNRDRLAMRSPRR